ncbi:hypothetical protein [Streptomyces rubiginosohelvolus]|uniref:hypothetical protein n=1 Tax=Streptomyces rubiginosohelvolus TaxID=67362 RepID=UPI0033F3F039
MLALRAPGRGDPSVGVQLDLHAGSQQTDELVVPGRGRDELQHGQTEAPHHLRRVLPRLPGRVGRRRAGLVSDGNAVQGPDIAVLLIWGLLVVTISVGALVHRA